MWEGVLSSQLGGSLMVPSSHYPLLPLPTIPSLGTQLSGGGGGIREEGKKERGETGEGGKKVPLPLGLVTPSHHPSPVDTIV